MIFAAGFGTRMGPLTATLPKPLIPVGGRPLIDHALAVAERAGVQRIVVNLHYRGKQLEDHLSDRPVVLSWEKDAILETGGGLRAALPLLGPGPVLVLNSDAVWTGANPLTELLTAWDGEKMDALLLLLPLAKAAGHQAKADFALAPDGRISRGSSDENHVYLGASVINPALLSRVSEPAFSLNLPWTQAIGAGRAYGIVHSGHWCDVGNPEGIALAEELLRGDCLG